MTGFRRDPDYRVPTPRPLGVTFLALGVLCIALLNLLGFYQVLVALDFIKSTLPYPPILLGLVKLICGLGGVVISWGLWTGRPWAPKLTRFASLAYVSYLWIDRLLLQKPVGRMANNPFAAGLTVLLILFVFWILTNREVQIFFGVTHEQSVQR